MQWLEMVGGCPNPNSVRFPAVPGATRVCLGSRHWPAGRKPAGAHEPYRGTRNADAAAAAAEDPGGTHNPGPDTVISSALGWIPPRLFIFGKGA
jgi:hypothetical protein